MVVRELGFSAVTNHSKNLSLVIFQTMNSKKRMRRSSGVSNTWDKDSWRSCVKNPMITENPCTMTRPEEDGEVVSPKMDMGGGMLRLLMFVAPDSIGPPGAVVSPMSEEKELPEASSPSLRNSIVSLKEGMLCITLDPSMSDTSSPINVTEGLLTPFLAVRTFLFCMLMEEEIGKEGKKNL